MEDMLTLLEQENIEYKKNYLRILKSKKDEYDNRYKIIKIICIILYLTTFWILITIPIILVIQIYFKNTFKRKIKKIGFRNINEFNNIVDKIIKNEEIDNSILAKVPNKPEYSKQLKSIIKQKQKNNKLDKIMEQEKIKQQQLEKLQKENLINEQEIIKQKQIINEQQNNNTNVNDTTTSNLKYNSQVLKIMGSILLIIIFIVIYLFVSNLFNGGDNSSNVNKGDNSSHVISCAKSALITYANYDPQIGETKILEKDNYGRYLVECYAKLVNAFGTGKYDTYYIIISNVHEENGEWYFNCNKFNGIYSLSQMGPNAKELLKNINGWDKPLDKE